MGSSSDAKLTVKLNNTSAALISSGDYDRAISRLHNALVLANKQVLENASESHGSPLDVTLDRCMAQSPLTCDDGNDKTERSLFLYQHAIYLPNDAPLCYRTSVLVSVIIIFNLALAHQLLAAKKQSNKRSKYLRKAAKLYALAHSLYHEKNDFEDSVVFSLASVNNLGLIYHELHDMRTAELCFQRLLSTLMFLVDCGEGNVSQFEGFFQNTHLVVQGNTAAAA
jgi:tetratricopeptide (TPR) repeat protein